ncbi:MobP2 family relaxase [Listeria innocua]|uniref:MobP2 family relaxase n=1 Tax=Listeria innocua TaxID=1642 RepID=UPI00162457AA|nr:MobP2 family relaxase [Listeria innocua]MBC1925558.1 hypothetical protein [Listeria innocua]
MSKPAVILTGKFARPKSDVFEAYIEYMDRSKAVRNMAYDTYSAFINQEKTGATYSDEAEQLDDYIDYMANPYKTSHLFTQEKNELTSDEKIKLKEKFQLAYDNESVMWQDVFSFDNAWLIEKGFLNPKTNQLDERKIQSATRAGMNQMLKHEGLLDSSIWTASIHYNTGNIHVHVATVEPKPTREKKRFVDIETGEICLEGKGSRSRKTLRAMKSGFANDLLELVPIYQQIDNLQKLIIEKKRVTPFLEKTPPQLIQELDRLRQKLPAEKGYWKVGYAQRFDFDEPLQALVQQFMHDYFSEETQILKTLFDKIEQEQARTYGDSKGQGDWQKGKWVTLYKRLGNDVLNELKHEAFSQTKVNQGSRLSNQNERQLNKKSSQRELEFEKALEKLVRYSLSVRPEKDVSKDFEKPHFDSLEKEELVLPEKIVTLQKFDPSKNQTTQEFQETIKQLRLSISKKRGEFQSEQMTNLHDFSPKNQIRILKQAPSATLLFTREKWTYYQFHISPKANTISVIDPIKDDMGQLEGFSESVRFDIKQVTYVGRIPLEQMMKKIAQEERLGSEGRGSRKGSYRENQMKYFQNQDLLFNIQKVFRRTYQDFLNEQGHRQLEFEQERKI